MLKGRLGLEKARIPHADRHGLLWLSRGELCVIDGCLHFVRGKDSLTPGIDQIPQGQVDRFSRQLRQVMDFDAGEGLNMDIRPHLLDAAQEIKVIGKRQVRMNATDHVDFADRFVETLPDLGLNFLNAHLVGERMPLFFAKGTEFTEIGADVGVVDMLVIDEKSLVAVLSFPDNIGLITEGEDVGMMEEGSPIFDRQAFPITDFCQNPS